MRSRPTADSPAISTTSSEGARIEPFQAGERSRAPGPLKRPFGGADHVVDGVTAEAVYGESNHRKRRLVPLPCRWALLTSLRAWTALVCRR